MGSFMQIDGGYVPLDPVAHAHGVYIIGVRGHWAIGRDLGALVGEGGGQAFVVAPRSSWIDVNAAMNVGLDATLELGDVYAGADHLRGTESRDMIIGGDFGDVIFGLDGRDILRGNGGDDVIFGGSDWNYLEGQVGEDILVAQGEDDMSGGRDADIFVITGTVGNINIRDFNPAEDSLMISGLVTPLSAEDLIASAIDVTNDDGATWVELPLANGAKIVLQGLQANDLVGASIKVDADDAVINELIAPYEVFLQDNGTDVPEGVIDAGGGQFVATEHGHGETRGVDIYGLDGEGQTSQDLGLENEISAPASKTGYSVTHHFSGQNTNSINNDGVEAAVAQAQIVVNAGEIVGTAHADRFHGTDNRDVVSLGDGDDVLRSFAGHDVVDSGAGNDIVQAGWGDDFIAIRDGDNAVWGGGMHDTFVIYAAVGNTMIHDYTDNYDRLRFEVPSITSQEDLAAMISAVDVDGVTSTQITISENQTVILRGLDPETLDLDAVILPFDPTSEASPDPFEVLPENAEIEVAAPPKPAVIHDPNQPPQRAYEEVQKTDPVAAEIRDVEGDIGDFNQSAGLNLQSVRDFSEAMPFLNVFKTSRPMHARSAENGGGDVVYWNEGLEENGFLDENGWPTGMPDGVGSFRTIMLNGIHENNTNAFGTYVLRYEGEGDVRVTGRGVAPGSVEQGDGYIKFDYVPGAVEVIISNSDPNGTGDYVRDISVVKEEYVDLYDAGAIFNPDYIDIIEDLSTVRFMDWMDTNHSEIVNFSDHASVDAATYFTEGGVPLEVMVELANQIGADPWFNIPHQATDAYVEEFATYIKENLDPDLTAYVEYSNEVWNWIFSQTHYAQAQGQEMFEGGNFVRQFYAQRSLEVAQIVDTVFGDEADDRINSVYAVWTTDSSISFTTERMFSQTFNVNGVDMRIGESGLFDSFAVTTYFGLAGYDIAARALGYDPSDEALATLTFDSLTQEQIDDVNRAFADALVGHLEGDRADLYAKAANLAHYNDLELISYEGGSHFKAERDHLDKDWYTGLVEDFNFSAEIGEVYKVSSDVFKAAGGTLDVLFNDVAEGSDAFGFWGHYRYMGDQNGRTDFLESLRSENPVFTPDRQAADFDQGRTEIGTEGNDLFLGTGEEDFFSGGKGDDTFDLTRGGNDGVHGGEGTDRVVLSGSVADYTFKADEKGAVEVLGPDGATSRFVSIEEVEFEDGSVIPASELW